MGVVLGEAFHGASNNGRSQSSYNDDSDVPRKESSTLFDLPGQEWTTCACSIIQFIDTFLVVVGVIAGMISGRETALRHYSKQRVHILRLVAVVILLLVSVLLLNYHNMLSIGALLLAGIAFIFGFVYSWSRMNYNTNVNQYELRYNYFI